MIKNRATNVAKIVHISFNIDRLTHGLICSISDINVAQYLILKSNIPFKIVVIYIDV